eukprot:311119-Prorocentrum_minimum.AAC.3
MLAVNTINSRPTPFTLRIVGIVDRGRRRCPLSSALSAASSTPPAPSTASQSTSSGGRFLPATVNSNPRRSIRTRGGTFAPAERPGSPRRWP